MAKNKKSFTAYCDWNTTFNSLPDDKAGQLIKHLFAYVNDENPQTDDLLINAVFAQIKATLKRDLLKWETKSQKNREIALIRWNKTQSESNNTDANVCERIRMNTKNADSDSDSDINNNTTSIKVDWDALIKQFNSITGKKTTVVNEKTRKSILARLKEGYTKQDLLNAIENCYNDNYHKETNHKYLTLEFISRPDKLEKFATLKQ